MAVSTKEVILLLCVLQSAFSATATSLPHALDASKTYKNSVDIANRFLSAAVTKVLETQHAPTKVAFPEFQFDRIPVSANSLFVYGLSLFEVKSVSTNLALQSMTAKIHVPTLDISGHLVDGNKNGLFRIQLKNAEISVVMGLNLERNHLSTRSLFVDLKYVNMVAYFELIGENKEKLSKIAGEAFIKQFLRSIRENYTNDIQATMNKHLRTISLQKLLGGPAHLQTLRHQTQKDIGNANEYFDLVLENVRNLVLNAGLDPMNLPNETKSFEETFLWVTWNADVGIYNGWFSGLSSIQRTADVTLNHEETWIILFGEIGYEVLSFGYSGLAKFEDLGPVFDIKGTVRDTRMFMKVRLDAETFKPMMDSFQIVNVGDIHVEVSGLELIDWLINPVINWIINIIDGMMVNTISNIIEDFLQQAINNIGNGNHTAPFLLMK